MRALQGVAGKGQEGKASKPDVSGDQEAGSFMLQQVEVGVRSPAPAGAVGP